MYSEHNTWLVKIREIPQILILGVDIPVKKRFRQTRYTHIRLRLGIKLVCADRRCRRRGAFDHLHPKRNSAIHLRHRI